jgi:hypothetical protein
MFRNIIFSVGSLYVVENRPFEKSTNDRWSRYISHVLGNCSNSGQVTRYCKKKCKSIPVTGRGGLYGCEMLRIPLCIDSWLTDDGEVVSPTHRPLCTPKKYYFSASGTNLFSG